MQLERLPDGKELYLALCIILSDFSNGAPTQIGISSFSPWGSWVRQLSYLVKDTQLVSGRTRSQNSVWLQSPHFPLYPTDQNKNSHCSSKFNILLPSSSFPFHHRLPCGSLWVSPALFLHWMRESKPQSSGQKEFSRKKKEVKQRHESWAPN